MTSRNEFVSDFPLSPAFCRPLWPVAGVEMVLCPDICLIVLVNRETASKVYQIVFRQRLENGRGPAWRSLKACIGSLRQQNARVRR
ncbi:MAG TPA: hypothetical protein VFJ52_06085, partial [Terriglobia bacterium]|nr:hypothetical protein [Terriglobia bacterium]